MFNVLLSIFFPLFTNKSDESPPSLLTDQQGSSFRDALAEALTELLVLMSRSDRIFQKSEIDAIITILREELCLSDDVTEHLLVSAMEREASIDDTLRDVAIVAQEMTNEQRGHLYSLAASVANVDSGICHEEGEILARLRAVLNINPGRELFLR